MLTIILFVFFFLSQLQYNLPINSYVYFVQIIKLYILFYVFIIRYGFKFFFIIYFLNYELIYLDQ